MFVDDDPSLPGPPENFEIFFGTPNLIKTSYRAAVLADAATNLASPKHPLRVAAYRNDLLRQNWIPEQPMLLCGGKDDPTVFFDLNTGSAQSYFANKGVPSQAVAVLDVESLSDFSNLKTATFNSGGASAVLQAYHGTLVPPFCNAAARSYFGRFLAAPR